MRWPCVLAAAAGLAGLAACGDGVDSGPFDGLPLDGDFLADVGAPVHVARDRHGVAHISAQTLSDAAFVQGYVTAHDRLAQMDLLRRYGAGTLAELFGAQDPQVIDSDLEMRMYRMTSLAQASWDALQASSDAIDVQVVQLLARYAAGVNRYAQDLQRGWWTLDASVAARFDASRFAPWSPVDSLVIARFYALSQSTTAASELDATELYSGLRAAFDEAPTASAAAAARRGISRDFLRFAPVGDAPTIAGFPNLASDSGTRSDGSIAVAPPAPAPAAAVAVPRPAVPASLFAAARSSFGALHGGPFGALGPAAWLPPYTRGDAWVLGAPITAPASAVLAADWQLPLTQPAAFYPTHLIVTGPSPEDRDDDAPDPADLLDAIGATIPGIPGVMFGGNGEFAWAGTASRHDVTDLYLEQIAPCSTGAGDCVAWTDPAAPGVAAEVPLDVRTEQIQVGQLGAITGSVAATYEVVPHHGPILPAIDRTMHAVVPRTGGAALAIRSTGDQPSFELRALYELARATSVGDGFRAVAHVASGSQSWMMIDRQGHIGWTTHAEIPRRAPEAYAWNPDTHQDRLAPFFVLPGDGSAEWLAQPMSPRFIPHAIDPQTGSPTGALIAGNADPVGATADGLPLDQATAEGEPLYVGVSYAAGLRDERIAALVAQRAAAGPVTADDAVAIQHDTRSLAGAKLTPAIRAALDRLDRINVGPPDVNPYLDSLSAGDTARLTTARRLLAAWTFAAPAAIDAPDDDSAATAVFHAWIHAFIERALQDELDVLDFDVWRLDDDRLVRIVYAMLTDPRSFVTSPSTQQPILCDNYAAAGPDDSCTKVILQAMVDAMTFLESPAAYGSADPGAWRWGQWHRQVIAPIASAPVPAADAGTPRAGDNFSVSGSDPSWRDLGFAERTTGTALRLVAQAAGGAPISVKWALPGGTIDDPRSPHDHDLVSGSLSDALTDAAFSLDEIVAAGEARWVFH